MFGRQSFFLRSKGLGGFEMPIVYHEDEKVFHLQANQTSYIFQVTEFGHLAHLYWGRKISADGSASVLLQRTFRTFTPIYGRAGLDYSLDTLPQELPAYGNSDLRFPAYRVEQEDGSTVTDLVYKSFRIFAGKPALEGLPAVYVEREDEAHTLEIELVDPSIGLTAVLTYTVYESFDAMTRSLRFVNGGEGDLKLVRAMSMCIDFQDDDFDMIHLSGSWARERDVERRPLFPGIQAVESRRGASSHQHNPFLALARKETTENQGDVYGISFVYSGNFLAQVEVDQFRTARVAVGIHPFDFAWRLVPGESFQTPEAVLVYSAAGLGAMSRTFHKLYRTRLARGAYRDKVRPILVNNWEATYFDFDADKIEAIARAGSELGIELFVLDDGWFGRRNDDTTSLGDWFVDRSKLPGGLEDVAQRVNRLGMKFGLWFEPEMVSPDSDLYRAHPDWCLHVPNRHRSEARQQLILDFSREDVCDAMIERIGNILDSAPIGYVKWDMNRHMTEIGSAALPAERQRETAHRYMLGLYRVMEYLTSRFPDVLFESCSGGGGRFDPGILYYMPQTWTSDNTDAVSRLRIQYGTSLAYPISAMGAHVSAVPNHQTHRITPLRTRGDAAMSGNLGYELDLTKLSEEEKQEVRLQVETYKANRELIQFGEFYRLLSPFEHNGTAWMFVSEDRAEALVFYFRVLAQANAPFAKRLRLDGLDPARTYRLQGDGLRVCGDQLMYAGIPVPELHGDFRSFIWKFMAI